MDTFGVGPMSLAVFEALSLFTPYDMNIPKKRMGPARDGGYTMADLGGTDDIFSFGISNDVRFEKYMANMGHRCFMYDHTIDGLPDNDPLFNYRKIGICGLNERDPDLKTLQEHIQNERGLTERLILKIDVEGAEWDALSTIDPETLNRFDQITGEFHWLHQLGEENFRNKVVSAMKNVNRDFTLHHIHANNCRKIDIVEGFAVADVLELSFVRTSLIEQRPSKTVYPSSMDLANNHVVHDHALLFFPFLPTGVDVLQIRNAVNKINDDLNASPFG